MHAKATTKVETRTAAEGRITYARSVHLPATDGATALGLAKSAFAREGFGVVAEIDFRDTLKRKLDKEIGPYWVLEVCNPKLADRAIAADRNAGLLMPCKVAVWQEGRDAVIAALRPEAGVSLTDNAAVTAIAEEAERHVERALVHLEAPERELPITD